MSHRQQPDPEPFRDLEPDDPEPFRDLEPDDPEPFRDLEPDDPEPFRDLEPDDPESLIARREQALRSAQRGRSYDRTAAENTGIPTLEERYSGDIIVRLSPLLPVVDKSNLLKLAKALKLESLETILKRFGSPASSRAITTPRAGRPGQAGPEYCGKDGAPGSLDNLEQRATTSDFPPRHSLWSYWRLDARNLKATTSSDAEVLPEHGFPYSNTAIADQLVEQLNALSEVDLAYREFEASDPMNSAGGSDPFVPPSAEMLSDFQLYLEEAPLGLDARWARARLHGTKHKVALADLEQGWISGHEDLEIPALVHGDNRDGEGFYKGNHGTAVVRL